MADKAQLQAYVLQVLAELTSVKPAEIGGKDRLREDLGLDSLQSMELLSRVSEEFDIDPDMEEVMKLTTVDEVVTSLSRALGAS
jgi:acyl carrier protein